MFRRGTPSIALKQAEKAGNPTQVSADKKIGRPFISAALVKLDSV
jgi:hypothetical protein